MRATSHNGRFGSAKHNGRNFDLSKAAHIDQAKTGRNAYFTWNKKGRRGGESFEACEREYYEERFGAALAAQNERHIQSRHEERIKTIDDWLTGRNTRPEECIYQIGDMTAQIDLKAFTVAANELLTWMAKWSKQHGQPFMILDAAVHADEKSPHMQLRRVWQYKDADGQWRIGQNKALEAAGVELPEPGAPIGPRNNRKITFDRMVRERWIEICEAHGYQIERTPNDQRTEHLPKEALIALREKEAELDTAMRGVQQAYQEAQRARQEAQRDRDKVKALLADTRGVMAAGEAQMAARQQRPARQLPGE